MSRHVCLALLVASTGCAMMLKGAGPTTHSADNPLVSGHPLEVTERARIGTVTEQDCDRWPFEDSLSVEITEAEICITARKHKEQPPGWSGEPTANRTEGFQVANDKNEGGYINTQKVRSAKVAQCFERGYNKQIGVWAFEYHGCAPNNGTVTATTASLRVGRDQWSFQPEPATTAATP